MCLAAISGPISSKLRARVRAIQGPDSPNTPLEAVAERMRRLRLEAAAAPTTIRKMRCPNSLWYFFAVTNWLCEHADTSKCSPQCEVEAACVPDISDLSTGCNCNGTNDWATDWRTSNLGQVDVTPCGHGDIFYTCQVDRSIYTLCGDESL